jgi:hypothetical protein
MPKVIAKEGGTGHTGRWRSFKADEGAVDDNATKWKRAIREPNRRTD